MDEKRWVQSGDCWKRSYYNDDPPPGLNGIDNRLTKLVEDAKKLGILILVSDGATVLGVGGVRYKVQRKGKESPSE